jgi:hypothetical protein
MSVKLFALEMFTFSADLPQTQLCQRPQGRLQNNTVCSGLLFTFFSNPRVQNRIPAASVLSHMQMPTAYPVHTNFSTYTHPYLG